MTQYNKLDSIAYVFVSICQVGKLFKKKEAATYIRSRKKGTPFIP